MKVAAALTSFVGRRADLERGIQALQESRLVTVTGVGGVGKTRLAYEIARSTAGADHPDGVHAVELATLRQGDDVATAVVDGLALPRMVGSTALGELRDHLATRRLLLVLDSCDPVIDDCRDLVTELLRASPGVRILVTSRERFAIPGERVLNVRPLAAPSPAADMTPERARGYDAVALLEQRIADADDTFRLDAGNVHAVVTIAVRLDGLPLALELAAGRTGSMSVQELAGQLDDRFALLTGGDSSAGHHHRELESMVQWSWDLCSARLQLLWARLSVFAHGADLEAVTAVCSDPVLDGSVIDDLAALVKKSVVVADASGPTTRYLMLETLAEFGADRLGELGEQDAVAARHAGYFRALARRACDEFYTPAQLDWTRRLHRDQANLLLAFSWLFGGRVDDGRAAVELAADLRYHAMIVSMREGERMLTLALAGYDRVDAARVSALSAAAAISLAQGDLDTGYEHARQARDAALELGCPVWGRRTRVLFAAAAEWRGDLTADDTEYDDALAELDEAADLEYLLGTLILHMLMVCLRGERDRAQACFEVFLAQAERTGESWMLSFAMCFQAFSAWRAGETDVAASLALRSIEIKYEFGDVLATGIALGVLAGAAARGDRTRRAAELLGAAAVVNSSVSSAISLYGPVVDGVLDRIRSEVRGALGAETFDELQARGRRRSWEDMYLLASEPETDARGTDADGADRGPLSEREFEVAGLVATGMTTRAIAQQLVLSPRTIDGHLERIFDKLGVRSRVEVAAWLLRRGTDGTPPER